MVSFDASATALGYKAPALVMHGCIHLIQPAHPHFYSPVFEKRTGGSISPRRGLVAVVTFLLQQRSLILCFRQNAPSLQIADCIAVGGGQCRPLQTRQCVPQQQRSRPPQGAAHLRAAVRGRESAASERKLSDREARSEPKASEVHKARRG